MSDNLLPINIIIGDRSYRIKVQAKDEEHVRKTVKLINDQIIAYKTQFAGKDMQDYIAMVVVWYATQATTAGNSLELEQLKNALQEIEKQLG